MSDEQQANAEQQRGIKAYRFRKGQSGNPKGRPPKAKAIPDILARITAEDVPEPLLSKMRQMFKQMPDNPTILEAILRVVVSKAIKGEPWAVVFIAERMEGKVRDNLKIEGGQTLQIVEELVEAPGQVLEMTTDDDTTQTTTGAGMKVEMWSIDKVIPYARNPRKNDAAVPKVMASLKEYGFRQPIVVDKEGVVIVGHTRLKAAQQLRMTEVPVHIATGLTASQVKAYRIADNRTSEEAEWDQELLGLELSDLREADFDLNLTGFDGDTIEKALNPDEPKPPQIIEGGEQGETPADKLEGYENSTIRQIVLIMDIEEFERAMADLEKIKTDRGYDTNTEAALEAIRRYANDNDTQAQD